MPLAFCLARLPLRCHASSGKRGMAAGGKVISYQQTRQRWLQVATDRPKRQRLAGAINRPAGFLLPRNTKQRQCRWQLAGQQGYLLPRSYKTKQLQQFRTPKHGWQHAAANRCRTTETRKMQVIDDPDTGPPEKIGVSAATQKAVQETATSAKEGVRCKSMK